MTPTILIVDDDSQLRELLQEQLLATHAFRVLTATGAEQAQRLLSQDRVDVVVTDLRMPGTTGVELCQEIVQLRPDVPVVIMTAFGSVDTAVEAIRAGAYDFLTKPFDLRRLRLVLDRAVENRLLRGEVRRLRRQTGDAPGFAGMVGTSPAMERLYELIDRVGSSDASVVVNGESGTGKELVARALHQGSRRSDKPFVALNCAALPEHLLESELFGHAKGAFTDARVARPGLMREAQGGTVFLDEIGDLSAALQPKLLRALQERLIRPVGGDREIPVDVRFIAATHRDLRAEVKAGRFRADLYYRLNVITVQVPALRERADDILLLAEVFANELTQRDGRPSMTFDEEVERLLTGYSWPGNVRELRNCIERCVALASDGVVRAEHLPDEIRGTPSAPPPTDTPVTPTDANRHQFFLPLFEIERRHILRVLDAVNGNKSKAAQILGIDRKTLHSRLVRYGRN